MSSKLFVKFFLQFIFLYPALFLIHGIITRDEAAFGECGIFEIIKFLKILGYRIWVSCYLGSCNLSNLRWCF